MVEQEIYAYNTRLQVTESSYNKVAPDLAVTLYLA